jgi:hypothetical protein
MIPFARTARERQIHRDPRPSLEERYGTHEGYVQAVRQAVGRAQSAGFLLPTDGQALIEQAQKSKVLKD